jgi:adenylylsulfate kinase
MSTPAATVTPLPSTPVTRQNIGGNPVGATVWLTGLPSAGKTTVARAAADRLRAAGHRVEVLDGDAVREHLSAGLGYSRADRETNISRIGFVAELLARNGVLVLAAVISPYEASRAEVRRRHQQDGVPYLEVHVAAPLQVCSARDVKGLYARQRSGEIRGLTGVDDVYEAPKAPDLVLRTESLGIDESVDQVLTLLTERGLR